MANQETQILDEVITSTRRNMLTLGLTSLAGIAGRSVRFQSRGGELY